MIDRILFLREAIQVLTIEKSIDTEKCLTPQEWEELKEIHSVLEPFKKAQKVLEGDKYVTSSWVLPMARDLQNNLKTVVEALSQNRSDTVACALAKGLYKDLIDRWGSLTEANDVVFNEKVQRGFMRRQVQLSE